jgi:hypothetical protein
MQPDALGYDASSGAARDASADGNSLVVDAGAVWVVPVERVQVQEECGV